MISEHPELKARIEIFYHAEFASTRSAVLAHEKGCGHGLQEIRGECPCKQFGITPEMRTLGRVTSPPSATDDSAAHRTTTLPAVVDMKREPRPRCAQ